ncbi:MAG: serine--tRNA ligase [Candidatus Aenigmarchaeota archaeon]|nr:serine--tRNA ligase [Candidatus Aenigmarchaeota archaeon]
MMAIELIRKDADAVRKDYERRRNPAVMELLGSVISMDAKWRKVQGELDALRAKRNELTQRIQKEKKKDAATIAEAREVSSHVKALEDEVANLKPKLDYELKKLPNFLHESVPYGKDDSENVTVAKWGKPAKSSVKPHGELLETIKLADFERAANVAGRGFNYLFGNLVLLDRALQQFALEALVKKGFALVQTPFMMRREPYEGVTDLSDFENVMYKIEGEDLYMIATSEHPIGAMLMNDVLDETELPLRYAGVSPCFRKEIGSRGVDTKGLYRMHQFNMVEQFVFCTPEQSWKVHEELRANAEEIFKALEIPYRVVNVCTGDIGTVAAKKYDIEAWSPRQNAYAEVVSCSNCTDYQARRLNIKYGKRGGSKEYVHTLNSTAVATSRAMVAIIENFQQKDGTVRVPTVLQKYMMGKKVIGQAKM